MVFPLQRRRANSKRMEEESMDGDEGDDGPCPLLSELRDDARPQQIREVRCIDNGAPTRERSLVERVRGRKNRLVQRVLVICRLAEPSRDLAFKQKQADNSAAIEQLKAVRNGIFAHSQSIIHLSTAICCFTGNSSRGLHDNSLSDVATEGQQIGELGYTFGDQVERTVLAKIHRRIADFERIHELIAERAKLVVEVDYAKRTLAVEQLKRNVNRIAERKHALQVAQLNCERVTRVVTDQLKYLHPEQATALLEIFQEYGQLVAQYFKRGAALLESSSCQPK